MYWFKYLCINFKLNCITKKKTCAGLDNISNIFFIQRKFVLAITLLYLFNESLIRGIFSGKWKISYYMSPIFKWGDIKKVTNYRSISIILIIPKIFKSIMYSKMYTLFKNIILDEQYGFISGRSTTNLLVFRYYVLDALCIVLR